MQPKRILKGPPGREYMDALMHLVAKRMHEELQKPPPIVPEIAIDEEEAAVLDVLCEESDLFARTIAERSGIDNTRQLGGLLRVLRDRGMIHSRKYSNLTKWTITDEGRRAAILPQPWAMG